MSDAVLELVEPIIGSDIALFSTHFFFKPKGDGKRVPWHEDSAYWKSMLAWSDDAKAPTEIVTVWLAVDPSTLMNGCMKVIPWTHAERQKGFSDYVGVDTAKNVFHLEIDPVQRREELAVPCILEAGQCSLHDARLMHGSEPNTSDIRRCGYTMRFMGTNVKLNPEVETYHHIYLARGKDKVGNNYADPAKTYPDKAKYREVNRKRMH
jgi:ectoine hydroxylase-related dioxygenase (phytanoyl-CoA dioxygenase family)